MGTLRHAGRSLAATIVACIFAWASARAARADDAPPAPAPAAAQDAKAQAEALKKQGNDAMLQLDLAGASAAYEKALELTPDDAALYYNLWRVYQAREDFPRALDAVEEFRRKASPELLARVPQIEQIISETKAKVGVLSITCRVDDAAARISINDKVAVTGCGATPKIVRVSMARADTVFEVRSTETRFEPENVRAKPVGGGPPFAVRLELIPKAMIGVLRLSSVPSGARVFIDGADRGNPPLELRLPEGEHLAVAKRDGYDDASVRFVIETGHTKDLRIELSRRRSITSRWWFWTGVGVLVVGLATTVTVLVLEPERDPTPGSIAPGTIAAPLLRF